eukprot:748353-Hanusia_phi.AAC.1
MSSDRPDDGNHLHVSFDANASFESCTSEQLQAYSSEHRDDDLSIDSPARRSSFESKVGQKRKRAPEGDDCKVPILVKHPEHAAELLNGLSHLFHDESLCDITIRVEDETFRAHRVILASSSDFFKILLVGGFKESKEEEIKLEGVDKRSFKWILDFIYNGQLVLHGTEELVNLLVASEHLGFSSVRSICVQRLQQRLDLPNALKLRMFGQEVGCQELIEAASEVSANAAMKILLSERCSISQVCEILESDNLAVDSENDVFEAIVRWVQYSEQEREPLLGKLLCNLRLGKHQQHLEGADGPKTGLWKLCKVFRFRWEEDRLTWGISPDARRFLSSVPQAKRLKLDPENQKLLCRLKNPKETQHDSGKQSKNRKQRITKCLLALGGRPAWTRVEILDSKTNSWGEIAPMIQKRMRHGSSSVKGMVYVVGGKDEMGRALASVERYNAYQNSWKLLAPMKTARTGLGVAAVAGVIYAVGGRNDSGYRLNSVECYNVQTDNWSACACMREARGAVRLGALNNILYAVGGRSEKDAAMASVEAYDPVTDTCELTCTAMPSRRRSVIMPCPLSLICAKAVEVLDGFLYAIGGKNDSGEKLRSVERYDPR